MRRAGARDPTLARSILDLVMSAIGLRLRAALTGKKRTFARSIAHAARAVDPLATKAVTGLT